MIGVLSLGQPIRVILPDRDPKSLLNPVGERARPGEDEVDIDPAGILLRFEFGRKLRRGGARIRDAGNQVRVLLAEAIDTGLSQLKIAGNIDDVQRDGCSRGLSPLRQGSRPANRCHAGRAGYHSTTGDSVFHLECPPDVLGRSGRPPIIPGPRWHAARAQHRAAASRRNCG